MFNAHRCGSTRDKVIKNDIQKDIKNLRDGEFLFNIHDEKILMNNMIHFIGMWSVGPGQTGSVSLFYGRANTIYVHTYAICV